MSEEGKGINNKVGFVKVHSLVKDKIQRVTPWVIKSSKVKMPRISCFTCHIGTSLNFEIPSFRASKIQRILCPKKVPKGAARAAAVAWALIMCPTTWTLLKFQPSLVALAPIIG